MKKLIILVIGILIGCTALTNAQDGLDETKRERLEALKVGYLTQQLELMPLEAEKFWPLYHEMTDKIRDVRKQKRDNHLSARHGFSDMSDAELSAAIDRELELEQMELDLKKEYNEKFKKILPIQKVAKLHAAEKGFRRELLKGVKDRRKTPGAPPH